jgi:hypothetical protein
MLPSRDSLRGADAPYPESEVGSPHDRWIVGALENDGVGPDCAIESIDARTAATIRSGTNRFMAPLLDI